MITTGIIREVAVNKGNFIGNAYKVELNIFQIPGDNDKKNYTYTANCIVPGGVYDSFNVGDKVFVGFLNNNKSLPLILGKIYQGVKDEARSIANLNALKVKSKAELPENTIIGNIDFSDKEYFFDNVNEVIQDKDIFVDSIQLKTGVEGAGLVNFNDKEGLAQIALSPNVTMAVGVDEVLKVYNDTDETLFDGTVVYRTGVKKETNVILEDYQLVQNGDFSSGVDTPWIYRSNARLDVVDGRLRVTKNSNSGLSTFYQPKDIEINTTDVYYFACNFESSSILRYFRLSARLTSGTGSTQRYIDSPNLYVSANTPTFISHVGVFDGAVSADYLGFGFYTEGDVETDYFVDNLVAYNITEMTVNGVKDDNGVLFYSLTNEQIKTQLDKWLQRGVSGTTKVQPAIANNHTISNNTIGVITEPIASNDYGFITRKGFVGGVLLDPNIYTIGQTLYLSPDVKGAFTNQRPEAPDFVTQIGYVNMVSSDSYTADGQIYVDIVIIPTASDIPYDNSGSGLESQTVKGALDELSADISMLTPEAIDITTDVSQFNNILSSDDTDVQHALNTLDNHTHVLPISTTEQLGVVKTGTGLHVDVNGTLSVTAEAVGVKITLSDSESPPPPETLRDGDFWYEY